MKKEQSFLKSVCDLAIPVTMQSLLQSSFSIVDQIMIGQLGSVAVAGVGLASKFSSIYSVVISAIGAVAGIMISQYLGQENPKEIKRSFYTNLWIAMGIAGMFLLVCLLFPEQIMGCYTKDIATRQQAAEYLFWITGTFIPLAGATLISTLLRCADKPKLPLYASLLSAVLNTGLNYVLIFGKCGFEPLGVKGAAIATILSQFVNVLCMLCMMKKERLLLSAKEDTQGEKIKWNYRQYLAMLMPILVCEVAWSLGENVYAAIYGNLGTDASAAMTLTNPIQGLLIGALCGLSQAASVIIGKRLGMGDYDGAYQSAKKLLLYGAVGSVLLSIAVFLTKSVYVQIFDVEESVRALTVQILTAYALVAPFKVLNMILGGGVIRSGGKTKYVMYIDLIGTWCFGVPLGLLGAFVLKLPVPYVYFLLSLEECVRFLISLVVFKKKGWMNVLQ